MRVPAQGGLNANAIEKVCRSLLILLVGRPQAKSVQCRDVAFGFFFGAVGYHGFAFVVYLQHEFMGNRCGEPKMVRKT